MVAIGHKLEQRSCIRHYYAGETLPDPVAWLADVRRQVPALAGFQIHSLARQMTEDDQGVQRMTYVGLFQRDGTTLEAQAAVAEEKQLKRDAAAEGVRLIGVHYEDGE